MLNRIIEWSVKNRFLVLLFTIFTVLWGIWSIANTPLDAIPDLSDVQVIIYTEYPGQAPQVVEDQITYPLTTAMLAVPKSKVVRGFSFFGVSFVYIIFEDGTDIYWARSRVLEYLNFAAGKLPRGVTPSLGPDATGVGWVYQYAIEGKGYDLAQLRSIQDWYVRYQLTKAQGVSEVASIGGFVKQYQVNVDPNKLLAYGISMKDITNAINMSNKDVGGKVVEFTQAEYMVRGLGYIKSTTDIENIVLKNSKGVPVRISEVARVEMGPDERRGISEFNGEGESVGGIVVMRFQENALDVIHNVKAKIKEIEAGLPKGVTIKTVYDRADLIHRAIDTLKEKLIEESIVVALVCIIFLLHFRSSMVAILMLPVGILISYIIMYYMRINANIMSLGGIAIAIGAMIDGAIVMIENAHKHIERAGDVKDRWQLIIDASKEVGPPLFYSLLIITVSFLPVFTLEAQEGRLFKPLAYTKTFAMGASSILSITLVPVLMGLFIRGKIMPENKNPITRFLIYLYKPWINFVLKFKKITILTAIFILAITAYPLSKLGSEFMPTLNEGTLFFMPVTFPGISVTETTRLLQLQDRIIKEFPEVESVFGKAGRALTATDPAPLEMMETIVNLKPEDKWRKGMTIEKLQEDMSRALELPGVTNAWTMPIKGRLDMLTTGIRTPVGVKIFGKDLYEIEKIGKEIEAALKNVPETASVYAERVAGGFYLDVKIKRDQVARYGLKVEDVNDIIMSAIGGENVATTVEGLERYPINVRYKRELRDDIQKLERVLVPVMAGMGIQQIPIAQLAEIKLVKGPPSIRTENALLNGWVFVDIKPGIDIGSYVNKAKEAVAKNVKFSTGYYITWSGQYEYMERAYAKLKLIIPLTLVIIFMLLYFNFKNITEVLIVMLSLPFSLVGGIWLMYILGYNLSVAVGVGFIALAGVAAETGVVMLIYLDHAYDEKLKTTGINSVKDVYDAIIVGAVERVRPKMMTVTAIMAGLLPIMWGTTTGSEVMKKIAAPMVGGMVTSTFLTLVVIPAIYALIKERGLKKKETHESEGKNN